METKVKYGWKTDFYDTCEYKEGFNSMEEVVKDIQSSYDKDKELFEEDFEEHERNRVDIYAMSPLNIEGVIKDFIENIPDILEDRLYDFVGSVDIDVDKDFNEAMYNAIKPVIDKHMGGLFDFTITADPIAWYNPITKELKKEEWL